MDDIKPLNRCHRCGCTSYKPVIERNAEGAMTPSGQYKCVLCGVVLGCFVGLFGVVGGCLGVFGEVWGCLGMFEDVLGMFGDVWGCLGVFWDVW